MSHSITISASIKFKAQIAETISRLEDLGLQALADAYIGSEELHRIGELLK